VHAPTHYLVIFQALKSMKIIPNLCIIIFDTIHFGESVKGENLNVKWHLSLM
jgi:hypothetical protein